MPGSNAVSEGTSVVVNIATTARMMCLCVLVVEVTSCKERVVHAIPVFDMHFRRFLRVWTFHRRNRRKCLMNHVDLVQLGGHVTNPEAPYTVVRDRGGKARHVRLWRWSCGVKSHGLSWNMSRIWPVTSIVVVEEWF